MIANSNKIIVSLTSFPARINTVHIAIESILNQTIKCNKLILWLTPEEFPNKEKDLPLTLLNLKEKGLDIEWHKNIRSYTKLIPTLKKYPDSVIITFDDDIIYHRRTIEILYDCHLKNKKDIIAHRITRMYFDEKGDMEIIPRTLCNSKISIHENYRKIIKEPSFFNKLTGVGGVLYPPGCFHKDILDEETFMDIAPTNDDIWFWLQAVRNNVRVRVPVKHFPKLHYINDSQKVGLFKINDHGKKLFFIQLNKILERYPDIINNFQYENNRNNQIVKLLFKSGKVLSINDFVVILIKLLKLVNQPRKLFSHIICKLDSTILYRKIPDVLFLKCRYYLATGEKLNLKNPRNYNEKIQWLKIYNRNPLYTKLADKYEVRDYVAEKIGKEYLVPLLVVADNFDEIDFDKLPNQFVIKCNHDCGSVVICKNKEEFDIKSARKKIESCLKRNYCDNKSNREWQYRDIIPKIIIEEFIYSETDNVPADYKIHCFNGDPKYIHLISNRYTENIREAFYDVNWVLQEFTLCYPNKKIIDDKPEYLNKVLQLAKKLSENIPYVRIDFYIEYGRIFFGELTFTPGAGYYYFDPPEWNKRFGDLLTLPEKYKYRRFNINE
jgi:hypothetical protein